jgi:zinc protease
MLTGPRQGDEQGPQPGKSPFVFRYHGTGGQAIAAIGWNTMGAFVGGHVPSTLVVLSRVLSKRLFDELRTRDGITYTPAVQSNNSFVTPGYGIFMASATLPAAKLPDFYDAMEKAVADLQSKPVSDDELKRARDPLVGDLQQAEQNNGYWLASLVDVQSDPRHLDLIRTAVPDVQAITAADLQHAAQTYLTQARAWKLMVVPDDYAVKAASN